MSKLILNRRQLIVGTGALGMSATLAGCKQFDFLGRRDHPIRDIIESANVLTYSAQRALIGNQVLSPTYAESEIRQGMKPNGSTEPTTMEYNFLRMANFEPYRLTIKGMVEREKSYSLAELRNMPEQTQITRHDCVEGWSCIAKWTGTRLGPLLDEAGVKPGARYCVYYCFDNIQRTIAGDILYYTSSDLVDAYHPQTILSYGLNDEVLPVSNGAPVRLRIERALGYKQPKYLHTIELVDDLSKIGLGQGGYWEDNGYDWFGGI